MISHVTERQSLHVKLLVGDIDGDKTDEVRLHRIDYQWEIQTSATVRVIAFDDQNFKEWGSLSMNGERGPVLDSDYDGKQEILIVAFTEFIEESEGLDNTEMRIYSIQGNEFNSLDSFDTTGRSSRCVTTGPVDWDGNAGILTQGASLNGEVLHQISVYDV